MNSTMARRGGMVIALAILIGAAVGCGEVTAADGPDAGGEMGGAAGSVDRGTGGAATGAGGMAVPSGTGGSAQSSGTGGSGGSESTCLPVEPLATSASSCDKLAPGGTYVSRTKNGRTCALCDPYPGPPVTNLPCVYSGYLCVRVCQDCD